MFATGAAVTAVVADQLVASPAAVVAFHARCVDVHLHGAAGTQPRPRQLEVGDRAGSVVRPHHGGVDDAELLQLAADALALELFGGADAFPCGGQLDQDGASRALPGS